MIRSFGQEEAQHHICFDVQSQDGTTKIVRLVIADKFLTDWNQRAASITERSESADPSVRVTLRSHRARV